MKIPKGDKGDDFIKDLEDDVRSKGGSSNGGNSGKK